jgi:hypothetical protein
MEELSQKIIDSINTEVKYLDREDFIKVLELIIDDLQAQLNAEHEGF